MISKDCAEATINIVSKSIRAGMVIFTAVMSIAFPYFGQTLGSVGGVTDAFQSFILPCIIHLAVLKEAEPRHTLSDKLLYYAFCVFGVSLISFTIKSLIV